MSDYRSRSAESGRYVTEGEAAANPSTTVREQHHRVELLTDAEAAELAEVYENAVDFDTLLTYVNGLIEKRG